MVSDERRAREVTLDPSMDDLAERAGVTKESAAIVEAEVRDGKLIVTVAGERNLHEVRHRLPDELQ